MKIKNLKLSLKMGMGHWAWERPIFMGLVVKPREQMH